MYSMLELLCQFQQSTFGNVTLTTGTNKGRSLQAARLFHMHTSTVKAILKHVRWQIWYGMLSAYSG